MKIVLIHPHDFMSPMEPWTIRILQFADELANKGHDVVVVYCPITKGPESRYRGVRIIPMERTVTLASLFRNTWKLCKLAWKSDIVHVQKAHFYAAIPALLAAYIANKPLHYDWDDWEERIFHVAAHRKTPSSILTGFSFFVLERVLPLLADSVTAASEYLKDMAIRRGANRQKLFLTPVGGDIVSFHPGRDVSEIRSRYKVGEALLIFYHGQLHSCQYVRLFLRAIRLIVDQRPAAKLKFMILGTGFDLGPLESYARELGLGERVMFPGFVFHIDIPQYVAAADICVAPFEDNDVTRCKSPLKIVEYLASGKPIVASAVGEAENMVKGAGLLVPPGSAEALAEGILKLVDDEPLRKTLSLAARQRAEEKYNWQSSAENLLKAYESNFN